MIQLDHGLPWWLSGEEYACQVEMWVCFLSWEDPLEKELATLSNIPRKSHGQRSLVGYSPRGHKRVGHNLVTKQQH